MEDRHHTTGRVLARLRMPLVYLTVVVVLADMFVTELPGWVIPVLFVISFAVYLRVGTPRGATTEVAPPVTGRWQAVNSPADRVPSHHLHAYGQTYAVDLVHTPTGAYRPGFAWWPLARRPEDFSGFGQPVLAPADGTVVRVHAWERDHWSRTSLPAMLYLLAEGAVRELTGPSRILGNHVVLDLGNGVYAAFAHLKRRSVRVRPGDRVTAGQQLAECGNSGNSTEPHLHVQLMDHPSVLLAAGLPMAFPFERDGVPSTGVPDGSRPFTVPEPEERPAAAQATERVMRSGDLSPTGR